MIGKICDLCGKMYVPYGAIIEQEDVIAPVDDILSEEAVELLDYETGNPSAEDDASGQTPEENGFRFLTVDPYGAVQYEHEKYDLCPECMSEFKDLIESRRGINEESGS